MPGGEDVPIPDPLIWLAYVAAATTTHPARDRHPDPAAAQPGDPRQGDRDARPALGRPGRARRRRRLAAKRSSTRSACRSRTRGRRTDEYVDVLRRLWREPETAFDGEFTKFAPLQVVSEARDARAARRSTSAGTPPRPRGAPAGSATASSPAAADDELLPLLDDMRAAAKDAGRDPTRSRSSSGGGLDLDTREARCADLGVVALHRPAARLRPRHAAHATSAVLRQRHRRASAASEHGVPIERRTSIRNEVRRCSRRRRGRGARRRGRCALSQRNSSPRRSTVSFSGPTRCTNTGLSPGCAARISLQPGDPLVGERAGLHPELHRRAAVEVDLGPRDLHRHQLRRVVAPVDAALHRDDRVGRRAARRSCSIVFGNTITSIDGAEVLEHERRHQVAALGVLAAAAPVTTPATVRIVPSSSSASSAIEHSTWRRSARSAPMSGWSLT